MPPTAGTNVARRRLTMHLVAFITRALVIDRIRTHRCLGGAAVARQRQPPPPASARCFTHTR